MSTVRKNLVSTSLCCFAGKRDNLYYKFDNRQLGMASFSTMAEQQPEEKTEHKPLSHPEKHAENLDDVLTARTIEELLKKAAKKLPQEDKQSGEASQSGTQLRPCGGNREKNLELL